MKKYFAMIALAALMLGACENIQVVEDPADGVTTIHAITGANMTKTVLKDFDVNWNTGDKLAVADEDDTVVEFTLEGDGGSDEGTFEGELNGKRLGTYAVYPYTANASVSGTTVTVDYLASWAYGTTEVPMWGENDGTGEYVFNNIGGAVLVSYSNVPATTNAKTFVLTSNVNITGTVTVSGLDATPSASLTTGGNTVTITNVPGTETAVSFVVPVLAGTGYTFTAALKDGDNVVPGTSKTATNRTITANKITKFPDVDLTPVIKVSTANPMTVASTASSQTITYAIANVAATEVVSASTTTLWISNVTVVDGTTVTFDVAQQPQGGAARSGEITLRYSGADDVVVTVNQDPAPVINLSTTTPLYVKETGEDSQPVSYTISYTISYPTAGSELTAAESLDWVTTPIVGDDEVTFTVSNQTHGDNARYGIITLNYPNANPVSFYVSQEGKVYTLSGTINSKTQNDINGDGITWDGDFEINTDDGITWRLHRGTSNTETKTIYCQSGIPFRVTTIEHTSTNGNKVSSISLNIKVGDTAGSGNAISDHTGSIPGTYTATIPTSPETIWYNKYYTFEYNITFGNKNGYEIFNSAVFYGYIVP